MFRRILLSTLLSGCLAAPALAAESAGGMVSYQVMSLEMALKAAQAALKSCRAGGYQIAVAVVDRAGSTQVLLRDRFAGPHTPDTAVGKAWTAVSFRTDTTELAQMTQAGKPQSGVRQVPGTVMIGGGLKVEAAGSIVGGIGVSGAPGGALDDACAKAGMEAISDELNF